MIHLFVHSFVKLSRVEDGNLIMMGLLFQGGLRMWSSNNKTNYLWVPDANNLKEIGGNKIAPCCILRYELIELFLCVFSTQTDPLRKG